MESQLLKVEAVREAIVIAREDGSGEKRLCAYFVADKPLTVSELRAELSQEMPAYIFAVVLYSAGADAADFEREDRPQGAACAGGKRKYRCGVYSASYAAGSETGTHLEGSARSREDRREGQFLRSRRAFPSCDGIGQQAV
ncbi:hypothetical protein LJK87_42130 [Paenibacillus sp. P25]|nr:hypothetical protein LJK87_42130 [Paenibacillus sp. P25]